MTFSDLQPLPEVTRENGKRKGETEEGKRKETGVREGGANSSSENTCCQTGFSPKYCASNLGSLP